LNKTACCGEYGINMSNFINYKLDQHGWADAVIIVNNTKIKIDSISYLSDAFGDMVKAILKLKNGNYEESWYFTHEPGETRFSLTRNNITKDIKIVVKAYNDILFGEYTDMNGDVIFEGVISLDDLIKDIIINCEEILNSFGVEGYKDSWNYDFPINEYKMLKK
jgi:hypothetical protein